MTQTPIPDRRHMIVLVTKEGALVHEQRSTAITLMDDVGRTLYRSNLPDVIMWGVRTFRYDASIAQSSRGLTEHRYKEVFAYALVAEV